MEAGMTDTEICAFRRGRAYQHGRDRAETLDVALALGRARKEGKAVLVAEIVRDETEGLEETGEWSRYGRLPSWITAGYAIPQKGTAAESLLWEAFVAGFTSRVEELVEQYIQAHRTP